MKNQKLISVVLSVTLSFLGVAVIAYGATTIGTAITTSGNLSVTGTGLTTLVNASTTGPVSIANNLMINGNATTTLAGAISTQSTLNVAGLSSLTTLKVGASGSTMSGFNYGTCVIAATAVTASSTAFADCTGAVVSAGAGVFVTATSSLPANFIIQAASSSVANVINLRIFNTGAIAGTDTGANSIFYMTGN